MKHVTKFFVALAVLAFLFAAIAAFTSAPLMGLAAGTWAIGSINLLLLSIVMCRCRRIGLFGEVTKPGMDEVTKPGMEEVTKPGMDEVTKPGMEEVTKPGMEEVTKPGMDNVSDASAGLATVSFVFATVAAFTSGPVLGLAAAAWSLGSANLALFALVFCKCQGKKATVKSK